MMKSHGLNAASSGATHLQTCLIPETIFDRASVALGVRVKIEVELIRAVGDEPAFAACQFSAAVGGIDAGEAPEAHEEVPHLKEVLQACFPGLDWSAAGRVVVTGLEQRTVDRDRDEPLRRIIRDEIAKARGRDNAA